MEGWKDGSTEGHTFIYTFGSADERLEMLLSFVQRTALHRLLILFASGDVADAQQLFDGADARRVQRQHPLFNLFGFSAAQTQFGRQPPARLVEDVESTR